MIEHLPVQDEVTTWEERRSPRGPGAPLPPPAPRAQPSRQASPPRSGSGSPVCEASPCSFPAGLAPLSMPRRPLPVAMLGNGVCPVLWGSVPSPRMTLSPASCTQRSKPCPVSLSVSRVPSHVPCLCPVPIVSVLQGIGAMEGTGVRWMVSPHCKLKPVRTAAVPVGHLSSSGLCPRCCVMSSACLMETACRACAGPRTPSPSVTPAVWVTLDRFCPAEVVGGHGRSFL